MNNVSKVALLKLIRDHQPISLSEISEIIQNQPELLSSFAYRHLLDNIGGYSRHAVEDLLDLEVIELENGGEFSPHTKLSVTRRLPKLQEIFRFSLTHLVEAGENPVQVNPLFGRPKSNKTAASIFVAMPFQEVLKPVYTNHIRKVAEQLGHSCKRGDDFFTVNEIMDDVWSAIFHSRLCIVECTGRNANVFYELGIAHTIGRKTILITQTMDDVPFDVRHLRTIVYEYTPRGMDEFESRLSATISQELSIDA